MAAYDPGPWSDLFVATAGASAALAGLVFVAVSINVERILAYPGLPERGLETVVLLVSVLFVSIFGLVPGQSRVALGAELAGEALIAGAIVFRLSLQSSPPGVVQPRHWNATRVSIRTLATLPLLIGGISLLAEAGGGLYWTLAGMIFAVSGAVANAWVLLVEILR